MKTIEEIMSEEKVPVTETLQNKAAVEELVGAFMSYMTADVEDRVELEELLIYRIKASRNVSFGMNAGWDNLGKLEKAENALTKVIVNSLVKMAKLI